LRSRSSGPTAVNYSSFLFFHLTVSIFSFFARPNHTEGGGWGIHRWNIQIDNKFVVTNKKCRADCFAVPVRCRPSKLCTLLEAKELKTIFKVVNGLANIFAAAEKIGEL
jgi:hypothetical protein